ncbi:MAG: leucine-rich repeat protein [Methanobrevibacter sp.]|nr:leucine-rich repeat protein [Methanobrevibacter sp.]
MANNCKFQKTQYQVSYDSGTTWQNVVPEQIKKGELIEYDSSDCTSIETIYRWRILEGQYLCDGNNKYKKEMREESYNDGLTWYSSYPTVYRTGEFVGVDANYCYNKFVGHYVYDDSSGHNCGNGYIWNGVKCVRFDPIKVVKGSGTTLTSSDVAYYSNGFAIASATIGSGVTSIGDRAFFGSTSLTSVTIPDSVTSIGSRTFQNCGVLPSITMTNVTSIGASAFTSCTNLRSVTLPNVQTIDRLAFNNCINLATVNLNNIVTIGWRSFFEDTRLQELVIGNNVNSIGAEAFYGCSNLLYITINSVNPPTLEVTSGTISEYNNFDNTNNCPIYVPAASVYTYKNAFGWSKYASRIYPIS